MNEYTGSMALPVDCRLRRRRSILYYSSIVYFSFLAIERIDLSQGKWSFNVTLELLGSLAFLSCYLFSIAVHAVHREKIMLSSQLKRYTEIVVAFLMTVLLSVPFSADPEISVRRVILLIILVFSGLFVINYLIMQRPDSMSSIIVSGMVFSSIVYAALSIYDIIMWYNPTIIPEIGGKIPFFNSFIWTMGSTFVRVRGASGDPNRAGIFMVINTHIILRYCKRPVLKITSVIINLAVLAMTLSRTSVLCLTLYIILQVFGSKKVSRKRILHGILIFFLVIVIMVGLYQVPIIQEAVGYTFDRFATNDESAEEHISFIEFGINETFSNIKILLVGNGYGASSNLLGHGKNSNFHNAFVSFLTECGVLSMLLFIVLLFYPLKKDRTQFPIIAVLFVANLPYQIFTEPYFWFLLPFICVTAQSQQSASGENWSKLERRRIRKYE